MGISGAGSASAQPVSLTLKYTCKVPFLDPQPFTAKIDADIPQSVAVGESSRRFAIDAGTTVDADLTPKLHAIGVRSVEGRVDAKIGVAAPEGDSQIKVPLNIGKTRVPASGSLDVTANGTAPALTFSRPGKGKITVGDIGVHVVGRKANGDVLGTADAQCTLNDGHDAVVGSFEITGTGTTTGSTTSGTSGSGTSGTTGGTTSPGTTPPGATPGAPSAGSSAPTGSATHGTGRGTTANTGLDTAGLILPAAGILVAGVVAFGVGSRLKNQRRGGDDG
ncbi:DUF6801 domain-containing protein [Streptomyces sp. CT34]|uniref:DUF6801 domain-containing protein n=1 Tax=Streptomyces sp. CT34 TaxID=1553907 RepID=UPI00068EE645|nr:DUF6801 domain-containing protein [Streptomyces sp. CT34]